MEGVGTPNLFTDGAETAAERRDAAMAAVSARTDPAWRDQALAAIRRWLETHREFFVDDFWAGSGLAEPADGRALGPVITAAARNGWMSKTDRTRPSVRSNLTPKPVWQSLIHRGGPSAAPTLTDVTGADPAEAFHAAHPELFTRFANAAELGANAGFRGSSADLLVVMRWQSAMAGHPDPFDGAPDTLPALYVRLLADDRPSIVSRLAA